MLFRSGKVRGRQAALKALVDRMEETAIDSGSLTVFISHGDCLEDAQTVADMVKSALVCRISASTMWVL